MALDAQPPEEEYREARVLVLACMWGVPAVWLLMFGGAVVAAGNGDRLLPPNVSTMLNGLLLALGLIGWYAHLNAKQAHRILARFADRMTRSESRVETLLQQHIADLAQAKLTELVTIPSSNGKSEGPHLRPVSTTTL